MNYRHAFHAGGFADVFKHIILCRILSHLTLKDAPFRVIDTHAGAGLYGLDDEKAKRTGEWADGLGRVFAALPAGSVRDLMQPWLGLAEEYFSGSPRLYPGSPTLMRRLCRPQDRLSFFELHAEEADLLRSDVGRDRRVKLFEADAWVHLAGQLPPPERRGLVFIDPPFEKPNELKIIAEKLAIAVPRWSHGAYAIWYPIKAMRDIDAFARKLAMLPAAKILRADLTRYDVNRIDRLNGCGMIILNPPWRLDEELALVGHTLAGLFAVEGSGHFRLEWLKSE